MTTISRFRLRAGALVAFTLLAAGARAQSFTPGDVVVYRIGTPGGPALSAMGNPVFLDEFNPAGALVQSIALPPAGAGAQRALVASGTATTDGLLTRSADGTCLVVPGYGRDFGTGSGNLTSASGVPRVVGRVTASGAIDTSTALTDAAVGGNFRGATTTDCTSIWVSGVPNTGTATGGIRHTTLGSTTSTDLTSATLSDTRAVAIFGGQLLTWNSTSGSRGVGPVGSGTPTTGPQTVTSLIPDANSPNSYQFFFADLDGTPGMDTLYLADATTGLTKFSLTATGWVARGSIGVSSDVYRGLAGIVNGTSVTLVATRRTGSTATPGGQLVTITDATGYNGAFVGTPTVIATAATNTVFRGVALAPAITITPSAVANGSIFPSTPQIVAGGATTTFTLTPVDASYRAVVTGCGGTLSPDGTTYTTAAATANCTVVANFTQISAVVTPSAGANGTISPGSAQVVPLGASTSFVVVPNVGYSASVGGTCGGTLAGTTYTTNPVTTDCTVAAVFPPLPTFTVTPTAGANVTVSPTTPVVLFSGQATSFTVTPASGYNVAVRGTCGGVLAGGTYTTNPVTNDCTVVVVAAQKLVLFVGNSFTHGRVDPVLSYNAANVADLTQQMWIDNADGSNADEPHPWGGIPGVFKKLTDEAGLEYDVSISARSAATLRGHYLNTNPAGWDLRDNIASQRFDAVVLQDLSDEPLPANRGKNADLPYFNAYVDKIEQWVHGGAAETYTESQLFGGSSAACAAMTGASASACDTVRIAAPANPYAHSNAQVFLYETWARPDMIGPNGDDTDGQFYTAAEGLEAMTADFHAAYFGRAAANANITAVSPVGDAFLLAVQQGVAMRDPYVPEAGKIDLWHTDHMHPSKYGSYLSALVHFATISGLNPMAFGAGEQAAADLGISPSDAVALQRIARAAVTPDTVAPVTTATVSVPPNVDGWNTSSVTITLASEDNAGGWGVDAVSYALAGAQTATGSVAAGGAVTISAEGVTSITYFATDLAGNAEASRTLVVRIDATAPALSIATAPPALSHVATADFAFSAVDTGSGVASVECSLDDAAFADCSSGAVNYSGLADGVHTFAVRATDAAGNMAVPVMYSWTVNTIPVISPVGHFVAFSRDMTWLRAGATVVSGDVGANDRRFAGHGDDATVDDGDRDDVTVRVGNGATLLDPASRVVGDTVLMLNRSSVYNVVDNFLLNKKGTVLGTNASPVAIPYTTLPPFPTVTPGTQTVSVAKNGTLTLASGDYGAVHVGVGATLVLTGGQYQMLSLDLDRSATVLFHAATAIRVKTELSSNAKAKLILDPSVFGLSASQMVIYVEGRDADCQDAGADDDGDDPGPTSVHVGGSNVVQANIYAPNGTVWLKSKTQATGAFIGLHVRIGVNAQLTIDSAFK